MRMCCPILKLKFSSWK